LSIAALRDNCRRDDDARHKNSKLESTVVTSSRSTHTSSQQHEYERLNAYEFNLILIICPDVGVDSTNLSFSSIQIPRILHEFQFRIRSEISVQLSGPARTLETIPLTQSARTFELPSMFDTELRFSPFPGSRSSSKNLREQPIRPQMVSWRGLPDSIACNGVSERATGGILEHALDVVDV
jgi:hypothetical protein